MKALNFVFAQESITLVRYKELKQFIDSFPPLCSLIRNSRGGWVGLSGQNSFEESTTAKFEFQI